MTITEAIEITLDEFSKHVESTSEINNGGCVEFALDVQAVYSSCQVRYMQQIHAWIECDGRCYDAENPDGVASYQDLYFFRQWDGDLDNLNAIETITER